MVGKVNLFTLTTDDWLNGYVYEKEWLSHRLDTNHIDNYLNMCLLISQGVPKNICSMFFRLWTVE